MNKPLRLLTVSNRGPVEYRLEGEEDASFSNGRAVNGMPGNGKSHGAQAAAPHLVAVPGSGGLATALRRTAMMYPTTWLSSPITEVDRALASGEMAAADELPARFLLTDPQQHALFYGTFANEVLWFLQHGQALLQELDAATIEHAWLDGFEPINRAFAEATVRELETGEYRSVMFHDYHFYLAPAMVRERQPDAYLQHFIHIPWPSVEAWQQLPRPLVVRICAGLLGNDSVVFQTNADVVNFLAACRRFLPEAGVDAGARSVRLGDRRTRVWANGISVEPAELEEEAASSEFAEYRYLLKPHIGEKTILSVDRLDPSKNVMGSFEAYARLLEAHPELQSQVTFLALLVPSRQELASYKRYQEETLALIDVINARFGNLHWRPMKAIYENNRTQALAAMSFYDVMVVNSRADGMNLVAKEGPIVNWRDGVLVLSRRAGAYEALRNGAIGIDPEDVAGTAEALYAALTMTPAEKRERSRALKQAVRDHDLSTWFRTLLDDIEANAALPAGA